MLRSVKYGETSLVVSIFTELFGLQSYIVNGVRTSTKKAAGKASMFQPTSMLDMVVYHNELKHLNRIKEFKWAYLYQHVLSDVRKNTVALFMIELLTKCLKQPESNADLFYFVEDSFIHLDSCDDSVMANFPLFFALHLPVFFGFRISDNFSDQNIYLDLVEGSFTSSPPTHPHSLDEKQAAVISHLLKVQQPSELSEIKLHHDFRRNLIHALEKFYALHIQDFGSMKTVPVLKEILS